MFTQSFFRDVMRCGRIATRLVSDLKDRLADGDAGANTGASVGGATFAHSHRSEFLHRRRRVVVLRRDSSGKLDFYFLVLFGAFWCFFVKK